MSPKNYIYQAVRSVRKLTFNSLQPLNSVHYELKNPILVQAERYLFHFVGFNAHEINGLGGMSADGQVFVCFGSCIKDSKKEKTIYLKEKNTIYEYN